MEPAIEITRLFGEDNPPDFTSPQALPVVKWKNVSVRLFCAGTSIIDIAGMVQQDEKDIKDFLHGPKGSVLIKQMANVAGDAVANLLSGSKMDNVLELMRVRDQGSSDTVKINAVKFLNELADGQDGNKKPLSPEEAKKELENILERVAK